MRILKSLLWFALAARIVNGQSGSQFPPVSVPHLPADVISFGADNSGAADSSTAFSACMAAAKGYCFIPSGTYMWTSPVTNTGATGLIGAGRDGQNSAPPVRITYTPASTGTAALTITGQGGIYSGFVLTQGNTNASTHGMVCGAACQYNTFSNLTVTGFTGDGGLLKAGASGSVLYNTFLNNNFSGNGICLELLGDLTDSKPVNSNVFTGGRYSSCTTESVKLTTGVSDNVFTGVDISATNGNTNAVEINANGYLARGNQFNDFTLEGTVTNAFNLTGVDGAWISGYISSAATNLVTASSSNGYLYDTRTSTLKTIGTPTTSLGQSKILNYQGAAGAIALSTNTVNVIWTYTVPANTLTAGRCLEVAVGFVSDSAVSATVELDYANPALQAGDSGITLAMSNTRIVYQICAIDSTHQQADKIVSVYSGNNPLPNAYFGPVSGTADSTVNQTLRLYVNPGANAGVHITPQFWRVTLL